MGTLIGFVISVIGLAVAIIRWRTERGGIRVYLIEPEIVGDEPYCDSLIRLEVHNRSSRACVVTGVNIEFSHRRRQYIRATDSIKVSHDGVVFTGLTFPCEIRSAHR